MINIHVQILLTILFWNSDCQIIPRIEECGLSCSQGIHCKSKPSSGVFNSFCHDAPASLPSMVLKSMKISTVMKCAQGSPCSLHLNIKGTLSLDENIRGLEICSLSLDTQQSQCVNVRFARKKSKILNGKKVQIQFNCIEVNVAQHIYVTMKTVPNYCEVKLSQEYYVEDCRNSDVGKYIPACSAGKFDYNVDRARKIISVNVSNFLRDEDYYVRLCHKWFTCEDVGAFAVIKGKESLKSVSLKYSQLLPCLCIEGWLAIPDARRIQLCPFENDTKALWDNIVYNPVTQTLAWEPACPVLVMVNLCRLMKSNDYCEDIQNSSRSSPEKVKYSRVDTHPRLCMKFTTKQGSWVKCPFAHGEFPAWKMRTAAVAEQIQVFFTSQTKAQFSVFVCNRTQLASCESLGMHHSVSVGDSVSIAMSREMCGSTFCIQGWRTDVDYSVPLQICDIHCGFHGQTYSDGNPAKAMAHSVGLRDSQLPLWWLFLSCSLSRFFVKSRISFYIYSLILYLQDAGQLSAFRLGCSQLTLEDMILCVPADANIIKTLKCSASSVDVFFIYPVSFLCPTQVTVMNVATMSG